MVNYLILFKMLLSVFSIIVFLVKGWCLPTHSKTMMLKGNQSIVPVTNETENSTPSKFKELDSMDRVMVGYERGTMKLKCEAEDKFQIYGSTNKNKPLPYIIWYKDGVTPPRRQSGGNITYTQWAIILDNLTMEDSGSYTCKVVNEKGIIDFTYIVKVKEINHKLKTEHSLPMLYIKDVNPHNFTASAYSYAVFECQLEPGIESYYIEWLYHNKSFKNVNDANLDDGITVQKSYRDNSIATALLKLINVTHVNEGWYTCEIVSRSNIINYKSAYLKVIDTSGGPKNKDFELNVYYLVALGISIVSFILVYVIIIVYCQKEKKELLELVARQSDLTKCSLNGLRK